MVSSVSKFVLELPLAPIPKKWRLGFPTLILSHERAEDTLCPFLPGICQGILMAPNILNGLSSPYYTQGPAARIWSVIFHVFKCIENLKACKNVFQLHLIPNPKLLAQKCTNIWPWNWHVTVYTSQNARSCRAIVCKVGRLLQRNFFDSSIFEGIPQNMDPLPTRKPFSLMWL